MVRDGIVFKDEDGQVIFNQHSFCELVKWGSPMRKPPR